MADRNLNPDFADVAPGMFPPGASNGGGNGSRSIYAPGQRSPGKDFYQVDSKHIPKVLTLEAAVSPIAIDGAPDIVYDALYDSQALTASAVNNLNFFAAIQANLFNGNLQGNAGQMPSPEAFLVDSILFTVESDTAVFVSGDLNEIKDILRRGTYQFTVSNKVYNRGKLINFLNPQAPLQKDAGAVGAEIYSSVNPFRSLHLPIRIAIPMQRTFNVSVTLTAPAFAVAAYRLFVYLIGYWYRSIQ